MFQQQMRNGDVTLQDYYKLLYQQIIHDKNLFTYFKQEKDIEKADSVSFRIKLMLEEIKKLKRYLK